MRHTLLLLTLLFTLTNVFGQKAFEGTIVYVIHDNEGKGDEELTALFGKAGIKLKYRKDDVFDKEVLLINFDSAAIYTLDQSEKTFTKKYLITRKPSQTIPDKVIAGYKARAVDMSGNVSYLGALSGPGSKFILYRSDSLFYPLPDKYSGSPELVMINKSMIVLGADIEMGASFAMDAEVDTSAVSEKNVVNITAKEIKWETFDEKEFQVPTDFTNHSSYSRDDTTVVTDTSNIATDTIATKIPQPTQKPAPKQGSKPKSKSKTPPSKDIRKSD